jgi:hypothetical protein
VSCLTAAGFLVSTLAASFASGVVSSANNIYEAASRVGDGSGSRSVALATVAGINAADIILTLQDPNSLKGGVGTRTVQNPALSSNEL